MRNGRCVVGDEVMESPAVARDGSAIDYVAASAFVREQIWSIWREVNDHIVGDVYSSSRPSRIVREGAAADSFQDLLEEVAAQPGAWLFTPTTFDRARFIVEWTARARRYLNNWQRSFHEDLAAGLEAERIGATGDAGTDRTVTNVHPALAWIDASGIDLSEVHRRFPPLLEQDSYVPTLTLLMWCMGRESAEIAEALHEASGDHGIVASDVFLRLIRLYRQHPQGWIAVASYCTAVMSPQVEVAASRQEDDLAVVMSRDGWRDPFAPSRRLQSVALLENWMERTDKLVRTVERPTYEWSSEETRTLVARRIATGFATHIRAYSRARSQIRVTPAGTSPATIVETQPSSRHIWAPAETFASIAEALPSKTPRNPDAVRRYYGRLLQQKENSWIFDLLPQGTNPYD
jgi:hypothetical protein